MNPFRSCIAVAGSSSFIGRHFVRALSGDECTELRLLVHRTPISDIEKKNITVIEGDLMEPNSLKGLLKPGCTVINLAYLPNATLHDHLQATTHLANACRAVGVKRLVHCSTAVVVGSAPDREITEETSCQPAPGYEFNKLQIELKLGILSKGGFDLAILRPTAVFGEGGKNLQLLVSNLMSGCWLVNYLKSCIFNHRKMNLVSVDHVIAALLFLSFATRHMNGEVYILSHDDEPLNNYRDIEKYLMARLGCRDYTIPRWPLPEPLLAVLLKLAGRSNANPRRTYSSQKILAAGFQRPLSFQAGLDVLVSAIQRPDGKYHGLV